jgi:hypothetical protein
MKEIIKITNDMVQPCDTTQARSDSDFGVRVSTIQFYAIEGLKEQLRAFPISKFQL